MVKKLLNTTLILILIIALSIGIYLSYREGVFLDIYKNVTSPIKFEINDTLAKANGKTAKVIILAGQSNAAGCSHVEYLEKNVSSEQFAEYEEGYDNVYINFFSTKKNASNGFVKCAAGQGDDYVVYYSPALAPMLKITEGFIAIK